MKAQLAAYKEGKLQSTYPLPEPGTTIGRGEENHIRLDHPLVSRRHCTIHAKDGMWVIKDLSSKNGIQVNGASVTSAMLKNGDSIVIGPFSLVFETDPGEDDGGTQSETTRYRPPVAEGPKPKPAAETVIRTLSPKPGGSADDDKGSDTA